MELRICPQYGLPTDGDHPTLDKHGARRPYTYVLGLFPSTETSQSHLHLHLHLHLNTQTVPPQLHPFFPLNSHLSNTQ